MLFARRCVTVSYHSKFKLQEDLSLPLINSLHKNKISCTSFFIHQQFSYFLLRLSCSCAECYQLKRNYFLCPFPRLLHSIYHLLYSRHENMTSAQAVWQQFFYCICEGYCVKKSTIPKLFRSYTQLSCFAIGYCTIFFGCLNSYFSEMYAFLWGRQLSDIQYVGASPFLSDDFYSGLLKVPFARGWAVETVQQLHWPLKCFHSFK